MCGRFNIISDPLTMLLMELVDLPHPGPDNFNAAPTETIAVLRLNDEGEPEVTPMRWWLTPSWSKGLTTKYAMFNARSETAAKSPAFREPFRKRRCVVPISGFYEWARQGMAGQASQKVAYLLKPHDDPGLLLAGLWDRWKNPETDELLESFTVLTVPASPAMELVHKRQPLMLSIEDARAWMDPDSEDFQSLINSDLPVALDAIPVSSHVNNARHKDDRCMDPIGKPIPLDDSGALL